MNRSVSFPKYFQYSSNVLSKYILYSTSTQYIYIYYYVVVAKSNTSACFQDLAESSVCVLWPESY